MSVAFFRGETVGDESHHLGLRLVAIGKVSFRCEWWFSPYFQLSFFCEFLDAFLSMNRAMDEGRVDLIIRFIPLYFYFRFDMAGNPNRNEAAMHEVS